MRTYCVRVFVPMARGRTTALTLRLIPAEQVHRLWLCGGCRR
jgi:hypothetical protein